MNFKEKFPRIPQALLVELKHLVENEHKTLEQACTEVIHAYNLESDSYNPWEILVSHSKEKTFDDPVKHLNKTVASLLTCDDKLNKVFDRAISKNNIELSDELVKNGWLNLATAFESLKQDARKEGHNGNPAKVERLLKYKHYIPNKDLAAAFSQVVKDSNKTMLTVLLTHHEKVRRNANKLTSSQKADLLAKADKIGDCKITQPLHSAFDGTIDYSDLLDNQGVRTAALTVVADFVGWMRSSKNQPSSATNSDENDRKRSRSEDNLSEHSDDESKSRKVGFIPY